MSIAHYAAFHLSKTGLEALLDVRVPAEWPSFPDSIFAFEGILIENPEWDAWGTWLVIHEDDRTLVGEGGYAGPPDANGHVEIGYAIIPDYRRRGLATEFALALTKRAFDDARVRAVTAGTEKSGADATASMAITAKLGMRRVEEMDEGYRWIVTREEFAARR